MPTDAAGGRWTRFWRTPWYEKLRRVALACSRIKGRVWYRAVFAEFGAGSSIRKPLAIVNPGFIRVGAGVSIAPGARLEAIQDNPRRTPRLSIGDGTSIEQNVHIVCHSRVAIGCNVSITGQCSIVDVTHPFEDIHDARRIGARIQDDDSFVEIGDGCFLGFGAVVLPNVRLGKYVVIGANSVVTRDVPDYSVAVGSPARVVRRYDFASERWLAVHETVRGAGR